VSELQPFRERALGLIEDVFGGERHIGAIKWHVGQGACEFTTFASSLSTFDFSCLTQLVVSAHDRCVRVEVFGGGPRRLKIHVSERSRGGGDPSTQQHPTLEAHVAAIRKGGNRAMQELYDSMKSES
jgi:hypothetical protein